RAHNADEVSPTIIGREERVECALEVWLVARREALADDGEFARIAAKMLIEPTSEERLLDRSVRCSLFEESLERDAELAGRNRTSLHHAALSLAPALIDGSRRRDGRSATSTADRRRLVNGSGMAVSIGTEVAL